jgi:hypothetical protein
MPRPRPLRKSHLRGHRFLTALFVRITAYTITFVAEHGVTDEVKAIRALLKAALRHWGLRAIDARSRTLTHIEDRRVRAQPGRSDMSAFSDRIRSQKSGMFKTADFAGDREEVVTIDHLEEEVEMFGRTTDVLHFRETRQQLELNQTRSEFLIDTLGDDPAKWAGQKIVLYLGTYTYANNEGNTIKIKLREETPPAANRPASTVKPTFTNTPARSAPASQSGNSNTARSAPQKPAVDPKLDDEIPFS